MQRVEAERFVSAVWSGRRPADSAFHEALHVLGIAPAAFKSFEAEARKTERGLGGLMILTPTGGKTRR